MSPGAWKTIPTVVSYRGRGRAELCGASVTRRASNHRRPRRTDRLDRCCVGAECHSAPKISASAAPQKDDLNYRLQPIQAQELPPYQGFMGLTSSDVDMLLPAPNSRMAMRDFINEVYDGTGLHRKLTHMDLQVRHPPATGFALRQGLLAGGAPGSSSICPIPVDSVT